MVKVKYNGSADRRTIKAASWKQVGVDNQNMVVWTPGSIEEVSNEAAEYLQQKETADFSIVDGSGTDDDSSDSADSSSRDD